MIYGLAHYGSQPFNCGHKKYHVDRSDSSMIIVPATIASKHYADKLPLNEDNFFNYVLS